jgi:hypothetical protein
MKHEVAFRVMVDDPLQDVTMQVQRGKDELLAPIEAGAERLVFEFAITIDLSGDQPNFLGKYAQGPKDARFVYVNSGSYAGMTQTAWNRRAKLSLMSITPKQVDEAVAKGLIFETSFPGVGKDGGPTCASVKGLEWKLVGK